MTKTDNRIRLSPLTWLMMTFDHELMLDGGKIFDRDRYLRLIAMLSLIERKRDQTLKTMIAFDALAVLLLAGKSVIVPGLGVALADLPSGIEVTTFVASVAFLFVANAQISWQGYTAMIDHIARRAARPQDLDAEFVAAADKPLDFVVKLFRPKMNIYAEDFFTPGFGYKLLSRIVIGLFLASVLSVVVVHFGIVWWSISTTLSTSPNGLVKWAYISFIGVTNTGALLIFVMLNWRFEFEITNRAFEVSSRHRQSTL